MSENTSEDTNALPSQEKSPDDATSKSKVRSDATKLWKVFNDPVHGQIELHPLLVKIIDTPQFQRLRNIKQLGGCYFVFPGAAHNRFEHSIGTSYLAGRFVKHLQKRQPKLGISKQDVLCVKIAGLCHDLGHGPFSHIFEKRFITETRPDIEWRHEEASLKMFDHLLYENRKKLTPEFAKYKLKEDHKEFIKKLMAGLAPDEAAAQEEDKSYLYEIVCNKKTGISVSKWDYFARDCHNLGIKNSFDHKRYIKMTRVLKVDGKRQICVRDKEVHNVYDMFHTKDGLFRRAYQHKISNIIEFMICEALTKADGKLKISEAIDDMEAYTKLSDHVYYQILYSSDSDLEDAKKILQRVEKRELYKYIGQTIIKDEVENRIQDIHGKAIIDPVTFDYGKGDKNPVDHLHFYSKDNPDEPLEHRKERVSGLLPGQFEEKHIRVYCRSRNENDIQEVQRAFSEWCIENHITPQLGTEMELLEPMTI